MKNSTRIISTTLAAMMAVSTVAVGTASVSAAKVKKPASVKAKNTAKGIKITWKKVKGAKKYQVFRGKKKITTTKKKTYTDKKAKAGKTYKYTVKAVKGKIVSKKSKAVKVVRLKAPKETYVSVAKKGLTVGWNKAKGAKKYYVYRGSKKVATVRNAYYEDKNVVSGTKYTYKVKAVNGKSVSVFSNKKSGTYLAVPVVKVEVDSVKNQAILTWNKVAGATSYKIDQHLPKEATIAEGIKDTTYTINLGPNPVVYEFKVYAVKGSASSYKAFVDFPNIPKSSYYTSEDGSLHVKLQLKKGEKYYEASWLEEALAAKCTVIPDNSNAVKIDGTTIEAVEVGVSTIQVKPDSAEVSKELYDLVCDTIGKSYGNDLTKGIFVDVTVTE